MWEESRGQQMVNWRKIQAKWSYHAWEFSDWFNWVSIRLQNYYNLCKNTLSVIVKAFQGCYD